MEMRMCGRIAARVQALLARRERVLVAIDGRAASGKTTLAAALMRALSCNVLHMDDFFLRPEQRTEARLAEPGGNVDYERFASEALLPLQNGEAFAFAPYCCRTGSFGAPVQIPALPVTIVEGAYSCHPTLVDAYDLTVFLSVSPETQMRRIRERNGEAAAERFAALWIPLEERYFSACGTEARADMRFVTDADGA